MEHPASSVSQPVAVTRPVLFWDCGCAQHHHRSEAGALACLTRRQRHGPPQQGRWTPPVLAELLKQVRGGARVPAMAAQLGISVSFLRVLLDRAHRDDQRRQSGLEEAFDALTAGSRNALVNAGLRTRDAVRAAAAEGSLQYVTWLGPQRFNEVMVWLAGAAPPGVAAPPTPAEAPRHSRSA